MTRWRMPWGLLALVSAATVGFDAWAVATLEASSTQALSFGKFAAGAGGTLTISPAGGRSATGGVVLVSGGSSAAQFAVTGEPNLTYAISLPANGTVVLVNGGGQQMAVNGFASTPTSGQLSPVGGTQTISVGATLSVGANQPTGSYSGSFNVSLDYN
jgi:hypothetical protein